MTEKLVAQKKFGCHGPFKGERLVIQNDRETGSTNKLSGQRIFCRKDLRIFALATTAAGQHRCLIVVSVCSECCFKPYRSIFHRVFAPTG